MELLIFLLGWTALGLGVAIGFGVYTARARRLGVKR